MGQDAVRVLSEKGVFENAVLALEKGNASKAERLIRENLNKAIPEHIQFRLYIRNQLSVYPTTNSNWEDLYENIGDRTITNFQYSVPAKENYFRVLAWTPESGEKKFVDNISNMRPLWYIKKTDDEKNFRDNVQREDANNNDHEYYDAVFIPDADLQFSSDTIDSLKTFAEKGRLVVSGSTLYKNQNTVRSDDLDLTSTFGIHNWDDDPNDHDIRRHDLEDLESNYGIDIKMYCQPIKAPNLHHQILYGFTPIDNLGYEGDNLYTYDDFQDTTSEAFSYLDSSQIIESYEFHDGDDDVDYNHSEADVLTNWGHYPEDQMLDACGLIVNNTTPTDESGKAIFIPANVTQTVSRGASTYKWLRLTANSISGKSGYELFHDPITISLWKGEGL